MAHAERDTEKQNVLSCKFSFVNATRHTSYSPISISSNGTWTEGPQEKIKVRRGGHGWTKIGKCCPESSVQDLLNIKAACDNGIRYNASDIWGPERYKIFQTSSNQVFFKWNIPTLSWTSWQYFVLRVTLFQGWHNCFWGWNRFFRVGIQSSWILKRYSGIGCFEPRTEPLKLETNILHNNLIGYMFLCLEHVQEIMI